MTRESSDLSIFVKSFYSLTRNSKAEHPTHLQFHTNYYIPVQYRTQYTSKRRSNSSMKLLLVLLVVASSLSRAFAQQYACGDVDGAPVEVPGMSRRAIMTAVISL